MPDELRFGMTIGNATIAYLPMARFAGHDPQTFLYARNSTTALT